MQEEVGPAASVKEDVVLGKKGDVDLYKDGTSPGCNCYMSITGIDGIGVSQYWSFRDVTDMDYSPQFSFSGFGNEYHNSSGVPVPFPTPFNSLAPPDSGCHEFRFILGGEVPLTPVTLHAVVRCYTEDNGSEVLATETFPNFVFQDGAIQAGFEGVRLFWRKVSCLVVPEGEEDCSPFVGGASF